MRKEKQTHWLVLYILLVAAFGVMLGFASRPAAKALRRKQLGRLRR